MIHYVADLCSSNCLERLLIKNFSPSSPASELFGVQGTLMRRHLRKIAMESGRQQHKAPPKVVIRWTKRLAIIFSASNDFGAENLAITLIGLRLNIARQREIIVTMGRDYDRLKFQCQKIKRKIDTVTATVLLFHYALFAKVLSP